ncbi:hypothetical protein FRC09_007692 [Ceratobasidium sp. 395]|nr:hypothetical protein FRC09_007692 [Ceratobasidium sp. 395]
MRWERVACGALTKSSNFPNRSRTELLKKISEANFDDGLNEEASGVLGKLLGNDKRQSLTALRFKVQDAKKKLKEVRPDKRKSVGTRENEPKKPRPEEGEPDDESFWNDSFVDDVTACCSRRAGTNGGASDRLAGCTPGAGSPRARAERFPGSSGGKTSARSTRDHLPRDRPRSKGLERMRLDVYQNLMSSVSPIQFAVGWQARKEGAKQPIVEATFRKKMGLGEGEELDKDEFKRFAPSTGIIISKADTPQIGSLVLLCPQLLFGYFRGTTMGANLSKAITKFKSRLAANEKQELGHRALVQMVIQSSRSPGLQQVFNQLEEAFETFEVDGGESE